MTVADKIKAKRKQLGWSQEELAKKAGYNDKTAISKLEHAGNDITLKQVKRIAKAMKVDTSFFMGWDGIDNKMRLTIENTAEPNSHIEIILDNELDEYTNRNIAAYIEKLMQNPKCRELLMTASKNEPEDINMAIDLLKRLQQRR